MTHTTQKKITRASSSDEVLDWILSGNAGCAFAQVLAAQPESALFHRGVFDDLRKPSLEDLGDGVEDASQVGRNLALLEFPTVNSAEGVAELLAGLGGLAGWYCEEIPRAGLPEDTFCVGLRWISLDNQYVSLPQGLATLQSMPATRQCPCTAIVMRIGPPTSTIQKMYGLSKSARAKLGGRTPVHLGDVPPLIADGKLQVYRELTQSDVQKMLDGDRMASAAHRTVTFALPMNVKHILQGVLHIQGSRVERSQ
jgi:hypothetical protein